MRGLGGRGMGDMLKCERRGRGEVAGMDGWLLALRLGI